MVSAAGSVTVTAATGGGAISTDTVGGAFVPLVGPLLSEAAVGDIGSGTIILTAPSGFEFDTQHAVTATVTTVGKCASNKSLLLGGKISQVVTPTTKTITIQVTQKSSSSSLCRSTITFTGVAVRAVNGTPLVSGNITRSGTSVFTNTTSSNMGTLNEVAGAIAMLSLSSPVTSITADQEAVFYALGADRFGNNKGDVTNGTTFSITAAAGGYFVGSRYTPNSAGSWIITATNGTTTGMTGLTVTPGLPTKAIITANPSSVEIPVDSANLSILVKDSHNNPVSDGNAAILTSDFGTISGVGTTLNGMISRTLSSGVIGTAHLAVLGLTTTGDTLISFADTTPPVIEIHKDIVAEALSSAGAVVLYTTPTTVDSVDGVDDANCTPMSGALFPIGTTSVTCNAVDTAGNKASPTTFNVIVSDTAPPSITLNGGTKIRLIAGDAYRDAGASASDTVSGSLTDSITTLNLVNTRIPGTYTVTYNVKDSVGNAATTITRTVEVVPLSVPVVFPSEGIYTTPQLITLTSSIADTIRYTLDTSNPTCISGTVFTTPISITISTVLKVIACHGVAASDVGTMMYTINLPSPILSPVIGGGGSSGMVIPPSIPTPPKSAIIESSGGVTASQQSQGSVNNIGISPQPRVLGLERTNVPEVEKLFLKKIDRTLSKKLAGSILLQVESYGYLWYLDPQTLQRYYLDPSVNISLLLQKRALKITTRTLNTIPIIGSKKTSSSQMSYKGRIVRTTDSDLWYVGPKTGFRFDISTPERAMSVFRTYARGINNNKIHTIGIGTLTQ